MNQAEIVQGGGAQEAARQTVICQGFTWTNQIRLATRPALFTTTC
jgi:hypothetical protein